MNEMRNVAPCLTILSPSLYYKFTDLATEDNFPVQWPANIQPLSQKCPHARVLGGGLECLESLRLDVKAYNYTMCEGDFCIYISSIDWKG